MKTIPFATLATTLILVMAAIASSSNAAVPDGIHYQAYLTAADGSPIDTNVTVTFAAYNVDVGGVPLWNQTQSVGVEQGLFNVTLGNPANPFPSGLFDGPVYIGLFIAGEELLPRRALTSNAYAFKASDADTLDGVDAADLDQSSEVTSLQSGISGVSSDVTAVQSAVSNNDARISSLESSAGDITSVAAGGGLTGGGSAGNVTLAIAAGGVNAGMLAAGSVGSTQLQAGSVGSAQLAADSVGPIALDASENYTVSSLTTGDLTATRNILFDSLFDIRIHDDFNGFRWFTGDGATQMASIEVSTSRFRLRDNNQSRDIMVSDADGIAIGTFTAQAGYAVTMPSLSVTGSANLGHEVVSATYELSSTTPQCHSHGNLPCFYGTGLATCPVGTKVISGGTSAGTARYGSISHSFPSGSTSWFCGASYDLEGTVRNCYAVCARID